MKGFSFVCRNDSSLLRKLTPGNGMVFDPSTTATPRFDYNVLFTGIGIRQNEAKQLTYYS